MDFETRVNNSIHEMLNIGYKPRAFMTMRITDGTINAVKKLINSNEIPSGFTVLWEKGRLDLSMEKIIQEPEWENLFTDADRSKAKKRLVDYGYKK
ncbi:MAG: hypothetical protein Ta2A_18830 [Treponemataceae bacterium]|nr:MAG: hypothetical protein Ta2A_18830 [Treponemataceae bacterium]